MNFYKVVPNDTPASIAYKLTGNGGRFGELVMANPQKKRMYDSSTATITFTSLAPGELLALPASWGKKQGLAGRTLGAPVTTHNTLTVTSGKWMPVAQGAVPQEAQAALALSSPSPPPFGITGGSWRQTAFDGMPFGSLSTPAGLVFYSQTRIKGFILGAAPQGLGQPAGYTFLGSYSIAQPNGFWVASGLSSLPPGIASAIYSFYQANIHSTRGFANAPSTTLTTGNGVWYYVSFASGAGTNPVVIQVWQSGAQPQLPINAQRIGSQSTTAGPVYTPSYGPGQRQPRHPAAPPTYHLDGLPQGMGQAGAEGTVPGAAQNVSGGTGTAATPTTTPTSISGGSASLAFGVIVANPNQSACVPNAAISAFQTAYNVDNGVMLTVDGKYGTATDTALRSVLTTSTFPSNLVLCGSAAPPPANGNGGSSPSAVTPTAPVAPVAATTTSSNTDLYVGGALVALIAGAGIVYATRHHPASPVRKIRRRLRARR